MSRGFQPNVCPQCGANIREVRGKTETDCPYCGTSLHMVIEVPGPREPSLPGKPEQVIPSPENISKIVDGLRQIQTRGGDGNFVIISGDKEKNYYIQLLGARGGEYITAEAVSNHYLSDDNSLDESQQRALQDLGWEPPYEDPIFTKNYHRSWQAVSDTERNAIAEEIACTFIIVYRIPPEQPVKMEVVLD